MAAVARLCGCVLFLLIQCGIFVFFDTHRLHLRWQLREGARGYAGQAAAEQKSTNESVKQERAKEAEIPAGGGTSAGEAGEGAGPKSILLLKAARTGSTLLAAELSRRKGVHSTQETLIHWERSVERYAKKRNLDANKLKKEFLSAESRVAWVREGFRRRMPKGPFVHFHRCEKEEAKNAKKKNPSQKKFAQLFGPHPDCKSFLACHPPFTQATPGCQSDEKGCFNQFGEGQKFCFCGNTKCPTKVLVSSFDFPEPLGPGTEAELPHKWRLMVAGIRPQPKIWAQTRSNLMRYALSMCEHTERYYPGTCFFERNVEHYGPWISGLVLHHLQLVHEAEPEAEVALYEDAGRNMTAVVLDMLASVGAGGQPWPIVKVADLETNRQVVPRGDESKPMSSRFRNSSAMEAALRSFPCYHAQFLEPDKYVAWSLPLGQVGNGSLFVDPRAPCCKLDTGRFTHRVKDMLQVRSPLCR
mmetsp:Transcript_66501/g.184120  ORF Transcript_66501/g.184120 Transcript_66501/m.184120 type:complete len:471 (+) Transcript_66501:77-1489(+)